jgi:hypothetical protein
MTQGQKEIIDFLEDLTHTRTNLDKLTKMLCEKFNEEITLEIVNDKDDDNELTDYNIMFNSEKEETYGYFDIYFLKHRRIGYDKSDIYITEVGYEF